MSLYIKTSPLVNPGNYISPRGTDEVVGYGVDINMPPPLISLNHPLYGRDWGFFTPGSDPKSEISSHRG